MYIVDKTREFSESKVTNIVDVELKQLWLNLLPHGATLCLTYADDNDDFRQRKVGFGINKFR